MNLRLIGGIALLAIIGGVGAAMRAERGSARAACRGR